MPSSVVVLRVKTYGDDAARLLSVLERELDVVAQPHTAGFVPLAFHRLGEPEAVKEVTRVLDATDAGWRDHIELRGA